MYPVVVKRASDKIPAFLAQASEEERVDRAANPTLTPALRLRLPPCRVQVEPNSCLAKSRHPTHLALRLQIAPGPPEILHN